MLHAIIHGKAGRIASATELEQSWRDLFRQREDLLTSVFFSRLRYLSEVGERSVLSMLLGVDKEHDIGLIEEIVFWPKFQGYEGRRFVEPDVLIECEKATLLVEVKAPSGSVQELKQWRAELESLIQERCLNRSDSEEFHPIYFVALGRNSVEWRDWKVQLEAEFSKVGLIVNAVEWEHVAEQIHKFFESEKTRDKVIYRDWLDAFSLFGLTARPLPFSDLLGMGYNVPSDWRRSFSRYRLPENTLKDLEVVDWIPLLKILKPRTQGMKPWL